MPNKRRCSDIPVPDLTEDPAERKRILNILAQRRYRKRKRDRFQNLQSQVENQSGAAGTTTTTTSSAMLQSPSSSQKEIGNRSTQSGNSCQAYPTASSSDRDSNSSSSDPRMTIPDMSLTGYFPPLSPLSDPSQMNSFPFLPISTDELDPFSFPLDAPDDEAQNLVFTTWLPQATSNPNFSTITNSNDSNSNDNRNNLSDQLQMYQSSTFTFPDDRTLEIPSLTLLNAAMKVAIRLNIGGSLWDISAISPFYIGSSSLSQTTINNNPLLKSPPSLAFTSSSSSSSPSPSSSSSEKENLDIASLPTHLQPTPSQRLIPHHPMFDILPWPGTRDRLIQVFSLPAELRPEAARDPIALMRLAYDMEDAGGEGITIRGQDPFQLEVWEIGQVIFERWCWAFETDIVDRSNRGRSERGMKGLTLTMG